jgi:exopolysaccharide biosynthesis polyprenyl glycosylphosphotransferase
VNMERPVREKHRFTSNVIPSLVIAFDLVCLLLAAPIAVVAHQLIVGEPIKNDVHVAAAVIAAVAFFLLRQSRGSYSNPLAHLRTADRDVALDYGIGALLSSAIIWQFGLIDLFSRGLMLLYVGVAVVLLLTSRSVLRVMIARMAQSGRLRQRVVLYGSDPETLERTCKLLENQALPQLWLVGVADDRGKPCQTSDLPFVGGFEELLALARSGGVDQVLIALSDINRERLDTILEQLSAVSIDISLIPREAVQLSPDYKVNFLGSVPILTLWQRPLRDLNNVVKAAEDLVIASLALLFLSPLLALTALAIKLTSKGPVLFVQPRFGFNNREIMVYKFRSMYVDRQDVLGAARTTRQDPRVTPIGRIIRKLSIDELPQLWNVIKGEMSIVGPRPHATHMKVGDLYYFDAVQGLCRASPGEAGDHRSGAGARAARRNRDGGARQAPRRARHLLHRQLVAGARSPDHRGDGDQCRLRQERLLIGRRPASSWASASTS